jgi:4-hydroxy-tetrahydrodipicolinate reductase
VTRIAIAGVGGRMGQALVQAVADHPQARLGAASEREGSALVGQSLAADDASVRVVADLSDALDAFDVLIDFTRPEATVGHAALCRAQGKRLVVGTTGLEPGQEAELRAAAQVVPVVYAPNMSVGVNLTFKLVELAAQVLGDTVDIEIVEAHHRHKVDAPSGTALRLGRIVADTLGRDLETDAIYGREGRTGARERRTIGFATIRAGDIVGEHTTLFAADGERLEITHRASSRTTFASGAVRAAVWLHDQPPGLYDMQDVLGLR